MGTGNTNVQNMQTRRLQTDRPILKYRCKHWSKLQCCWGPGTSQFIQN